MAKLKTISAAFLAASALGGPAFAQGAAPITNRDVLGEWTLAITPAERPGVTVTIKSKDGARPDLPLTIAAQTGGRLTCVVRGDPAECRVQDGKLVVTVSLDSGGARMMFTLTDRTRAGFSGAASLKVRLLPFGGHIGSVTMVRR